MHPRLKKYDPKLSNNLHGGEGYPEAFRYKEALRTNLALPIPGAYPSKTVATLCTEQQVAAGCYAISIYTDTSADYRDAKPVFLASVIASIEAQLKCSVIAEILPQADTTTYVNKKKVRRLSPWVLEIRTTEKWGKHWLHDYKGPACPTGDIDPHIRGHTSTMTNTMNLVSLPHPKQVGAGGARKEVTQAFTLALPAAVTKGPKHGQVSGGMAREESRTAPRAVYIAGLHLNCSPDKFFREIAPRVVARAVAAGTTIPEIERPPTM